MRSVKLIRILLLLLVAKSACVQKSKHRGVNILFTSDVHYGLKGCL
ncbi:MAG: hypothetical protein WC615_02955 [Mucilaginibacter sp.]|jgi:hypothetical protein